MKNKRTKMEQENLEKIKSIVEKTQMRNEALSILKDVGVFIPFDSRVHAYHGRANTTGQTFIVKGDFDNSGNKTGFHNVNSTPGLHTSTFEIAKKYALIRTKQYNAIEGNAPERWQALIGKGFTKGTPEVHRIVASHPDLYIFDLCKTYDMDDLSFLLKELDTQIPQEEINEFYEYQLTDSQRKQMEHATKLLAKTVSIQELMPELFEDEKAANKVLFDLQQICERNKDLKLVTDDDLEDYVSKAAGNNPKTEGLIRAMAGSVNVYQYLAEYGDLPFVIRKYQSQFDFTNDCTLNLTCAKNFLENQNIVGAHQKIWTSSVINKNGFNEYFFFDTSKIKAEDVVKLQPMEDEKSNATNYRTI